jgi:hypothetical protein
MSLIRHFIDRIRQKRATPVIDTPYGAPVPEWLRHQAAINMKLDPFKRAQVEEIVIRECGGDREAGLKEARRRYPEAYQ